MATQNNQVPPDEDPRDAHANQIFQDAVFVDRKGNEVALPPLGPAEMDPDDEDDEEQAVD